MRRPTMQAACRFAVAAALAGTVSTPTAAQASTASVDTENARHLYGSLHVQANAGEKNVIRIEPSTPTSAFADAVRISDAAGIDAGAGCMPVTGHEVICPHLPNVGVWLGDEDDEMDARGLLEAVVVAYGGAGDDNLFGGDHVSANLFRGDYLYGEEGRDTVVGGAGHDLLGGGDGNDSLDGGPGADRLFLRDGEQDAGSCGDGGDAVTADAAALDTVTEDCETVERPQQATDDTGNGGTPAEDPAPDPQITPTEDPTAGDAGAPGRDTGDGSAPRTDTGADDRGAQATDGTASRTGSSSTVDRTAPALRLTRTALRARRGARALRLPAACPANEHVCRGTVVLTARQGRRSVVVARGGFAIAGGRKEAVRLRLTSAGRRLVARRRALRITAVVDVTDSAGNGRRVHANLKLTRG